MSTARFQGFMTITLALSIAASLSACGGSDNETTGGGGEGGAPTLFDPSPETQAVWTEIQGYASWPKFAGHETIAPSASHGNMHVLTYHNDVVSMAITNKTLPLPDGALVVKENYTNPDDATPAVLTIMAKRSGAWYWVRATPDGKVFPDPTTNDPMEGSDVPKCVGCHMGAQANDMIFLHDFSM